MTTKDYDFISSGEFHDNWILELKGNNFIDKITGKKINEETLRLLDIQKDVRIQRQQDTMDKARPFLMDESLDFIRRENFASGSKFEPNISIFEDIVLNFNQGNWSSRLVIFLFSVT